MKEILKKEWLFAVIVAVVAFAAFANTLNGDFVYDDNRQILKNPLIQDSKLYGKALVSDVWAFKGDGSSAASNYWRPTFTALNIAEFAAFGPNPAGWHVVNVLLHAVVCVLGFCLLMIWGIGRIPALILALIFAVHPVHSESVAWIASSPDILLGLFILLSLIAFESWLGERKPLSLAASILFYLLALGSKETALFCWPIFAVAMNCRREKRPSAAQAGVIAPYVVAAAAYFFARIAVIGELFHSVDDPTGLRSGLLSVPEVFVFYLKQIFLPISLAEDYPLRPVVEIGMTNFILPLILALAVAAVLAFLAWKDKLAALGLALFIFPLAPALYTRYFPSDQFVHDRYLYLALLGMLIVVYSAVSRLVSFESNAVRKAVVAVAGVLILAFAIRTVAYNPVWNNNLSLWENNVKVAPDSPKVYLNYAAELTERERFRDSIAAYDRSIELKTTPLALMGRARNYMAVNEFDKAVQDLQTAINMPEDQVNTYTLYQTYETYAVLLQSQKKLDGAEKLLREARTRLPVYYAALTEKLAIILYVSGRKQDAVNELESARSRAKIEMLDGSKNVLFRLGLLYAEAGNSAQAKSDLTEFLDSTANLSSPTVLADRKQAQAALARLKR